MEEVIAKRHNAAGAGYIFVILVGILLIIGGIVVGGEEPGALLIGLIVGVLMLAMGIYYVVKFFMLPSKVIVYKDGVLYLPKNVTCRPEELEKVFVKVYRGRYGSVSRYGKMEITVHGTVYKYNNIACVKEAQERLLELNRQAIDSLSRPEPAQEPAAPSDDPFAD